jgi:hypothetical protein
LDRDRLVLEIGQVHGEDRHTGDRRQVRADVEVSRTGRDPGGENDRHHRRVDPGPQQPKSNARIDTGKDGRGPEQEHVKAADPIDDRHRAFAEPLIRDPLPPGERERERVAVNEPLGENPIPGGHVPERARVVKKPRPAADQEHKPDAEEEPRRRAEIALHAGSLGRSRT